MRGISGYVIDQYDDRNGEILSRRLPDPRHIPSFVKTAHRLSGEEIKNLSDDGFALVLLDGGQKMKKFAMVDAGNTALSVMYLLEQGHLLPTEAVKVAAVNLINACEHYQIAIPEQLKIAAKTGVSGVSGKKTTPYANSKILKMQFDSPKESDGNYQENPELGKDEEDEDLKSRANLDSPQGTNFAILPHFSQKETLKGDSNATDTVKQATEKFAYTIGELSAVTGTLGAGAGAIGGAWKAEKGKRLKGAGKGALVGGAIGAATPIAAMAATKGGRGHLAADYAHIMKKTAGPFGRAGQLLKGGRTMGEVAARHGVNFTGDAKAAATAAASRAGNHPLRSFDMHYDANKAHHHAWPHNAATHRLKGFTGEMGSEAIKSNLSRAGAVGAVGAAGYGAHKALQKKPGEMQKTAGAFGDAPGEVRTRQKSWKGVEYIDVTGWQPKLASQDPEPVAEKTLLRGHYPVDTFDQTKTAAAYFAENWKQFAPRDRHSYCVKLASRMEELLMEVPENVARYGSTTYAADVDDLVGGRRALVQEEYRPHLDMLLEKRASVQPETFAEALSDFDQMTELQYHYGSHVVDPWYATFGPSREKLASESWSYNQMGCYTNEAELKSLAMNGHHLICKSFGSKFADEFAKSPKAFFEALPAPNKLVLARLSSDRHAGTGTE